MELSTRARRRIATVLALVLAVESVSAVSVAASTVGAPAGGPVAAPAAAAAAGSRSSANAVATRPRTPAPRAASALPGVVEAALAAAMTNIAVDLPAVPVAPAAKPKRHDLPEGLPKVVAQPEVQAPAPAAAKPASSGASAKPKASNHSNRAQAPVFKGTNHVWIPALGISKSVHWFPCERSRPPDNYMYRWGCAGANNVYLMGHAYSVMAPLHDAYVSGRLYKGMKAYYAGSDGAVHVYSVRWWKLTRPTTDAAWAWAAQDVPSMTLQTCVGADSQWRLMVRLVEVRG